MGGWRETLVKELHVTPLFREPLEEVTTTTDRRRGENKGKGVRTKVFTCGGN